MSQFNLEPKEEALRVACVAYAEAIDAEAKACAEHNDYSWDWYGQTYFEAIDKAWEDVLKAARALGATP